MLALAVRKLFPTGNSISDSVTTVTFVLPDDDDLRLAFFGVLSELTYPETWMKVGTLTELECASKFAEMIYNATK